MEQHRQILEIAERLFMRYGLKSVSMDDVAAEAGISKKTLYQLVPSKGELIDRIIESHVCSETDMIEELRANAVDALEEMLAISDMITETLGQMSPALLFDLRKYYRKSWEKINNLQRGHIYEVVHSNLESGIRQGLYRPDLDTAVVAILYVQKSLALIDDTVFPAASFAREALVRSHILYHLHGILSKNGRARLKTLTS
jgi:TetR/AcrR family transcriptional regulator, cholesterol catabolism regulator